MAPVTTTTTGISRQPIDDPDLVALIQTLSSYSNDNSQNDNVDIEGLVGELERFDEWKFNEQSDLFEWIQPLDAMDSALRKLIKDYPSLFLIAPPIAKKIDLIHPSPSSSSSVQAESENQVDSVPPSIKYAISTILRFLSFLLRNSYNKHVFNSVNEIIAFLAAADDDIESRALEVLSSLALPCQIHRMSVPDTSQNGTTVLHNSPLSVTHSRLMMLAKGWGSRGSGLGLDTCVMTDDSISGQGSLPQFAGEVSFEFLPPNSMKAIHVHLSADDICLRRHSSSGSYSGLDKQVEKKRKTAITTTVGGGCGPASSETKSTSYLFFHCLEQIGGRDKIGKEKLFELLVHIRLAKSFHSRAARIKGVERRLCALLTMVYSHPSQDILAGYFHAQPELCVELTDLIRPMVSQTAVSSVQSLIRNSIDNGKDENKDEQMMKIAVVQSIVDPYSSIPYEIRILALEVITALVWRKDDGMGNGTNIARQANVLGELGVTKGQFSGLLATLIRFSLASLKSIVPRRTDIEEAGKEEENNLADQDVEMRDNENCDNDEMAESNFGLELGVAFVNTTRPKPLYKQESSERKALEFISCVLSLAYAVVTVSTGTQVLTECGLIPVLVSTIALDNALLSSNNSEDSSGTTMIKLVIAQSIQLLEGSVSNYNQALSAFQELNGIEMLIKCLSTEAKCIQSQSDQSRSSKKLQGPDRVLMYSLLNCLTIVCHLQETSSRLANVSLTPGDVLRRKEMTDLLIEIMDNVQIYGGVLGSLAITFLGDTMNSDPRIVRYVYSCGLADSFFHMLKSGSDSDMATGIKSPGLSAVYHSLDSKRWHEPRIPPSSEIIASLPGAITALALTEEGRKRIADVNPIPEILGILCSPKFTMPESRCLAGDMSSIIGSGLDELIRHVPSLKGIVIEAVVLFLKRVVFVGENVVKAELDFAKDANTSNAALVSKSRIQLMHYVHNANQILEQILQNDEQCLPFADAGGVEVLLKLHPLLMTSGTQFLAHVSSQSSPSVAILSHSTTAVSIATAIKRVASNSFAIKVVKQVNEALGNSLDKLEASIIALRAAKEAPHVDGLCFDKNDYCHEMNTSGILEGVPHLPLHLQLECSTFKAMVLPLSIFLRDIVNIEWMSLLLASILKMPQGADLGPRFRNQWQFTTSNEFNLNLSKLSTLYRTSCFEVCRVRTGKDFNVRDAKRWDSPGQSDFHPAVYRLRIVCAEGAVVRDGIDIDSCASIGGLEMGEEVDAFDRCINGSGIMRYRTSKGWVSEQTRGNSREPISEVLEVRGISQKRALTLNDNPETKKAIYCGIVDLCSASASILARLQNSQCVLHTTLSRAIAIGLKSMATHSHLFGPDNSSHVGKLTVEVSKFLRLNINMIKIHESTDQLDTDLQRSAKAMYLGNVLNILHSCIYEERRDKQVLNVLLVCNLLIHDGMSDNIFIPGDIQNMKKDNVSTTKHLSSSSFFAAIQFVLRYCLDETSKPFVSQKNNEYSSKQVLMQSKVVASCFLPTISLLRRLVSQTLHIESNNVTAYLYKLSGKEFIKLIASDVENVDAILENNVCSFRQDSFARSIHFDISLIAEELWRNSNLKHVPPQILNPILSFMNEVFISLENSTKIDANEASSTRQLAQQMLLRNRQAPALPNQTLEDVSRFQANEETIQRMIDMGFSRDHAIDAIQSSRSNVLEVAMEYALLHPPSNQSSTRETDTQRLPGSNNSDVTSPETIEVTSTNEKSLPNSISVEGGTKNMNELSESERKKLAEKVFDENVIDLSKCRLECMKGSIVDYALNIIDWSLHSLRNEAMTDVVASTMETNAEVINVLVCTFLLDLYDRYPDERSNLISQVLDHLKNHLDIDTKGNYKVKDGRARNFASMCHVIAIFLRALPEARSALLKHNLVSCIIQSLRSFSSELKQSKNRCQKAWPSWLAPALLIVTVMAEPISLEKDGTNAEPKGLPNNKGDYERVVGEHRRQRGYLAKVSKKISLSLDKANKKAKQKESKKETQEEMNPEQINAFTNAPTYAPLLTQDMCESVMISCLHILRAQQKNEPKESGTFYMTPIVAHALLLALSKVLRYQRVASSCLRMGGAELLLSLQHQSRFKGHVHLVMIVLRTLMEDECTLQNIMESEIRATVYKLIKKRNIGSNVERNSLTSRSFVENVSALICRDPVVFLKAAVSSIKVTPSATSNGPQHIELLSPDEKAKNTKILSEIFRTNHLYNSSACVSNQKTSGTPSKRVRHQKTNLNSASKNVKTKSPCSGSKKAQKKEKLERFVKVIGSPASHVISQVMTALLRYYSCNEMKDDWSFLSTVEFLEIIGDLLLVVPACAGAILNFPVNGINMKIKHAISGSLLPGQNIVNFLIHEIMPQPRNTPSKQGDHRFSKEYEEEVRSLYIKTKMSQNAARILVVLVARVGEGRRRVISELSNAFKLHSDHDIKLIDSAHNDDKVMWALNCWGELILGLAAPRRNNQSHDSDSTLSFEVVKIMQDHGMAHALMNGIKYINLEHPLAARTAASLLRPLENFTRPTVTNAIENLVKKADEKKSKSKGDDAIIADCFDAEERGRNWLYHNDDTELDETDDVMEEDYDEMDDEDSLLMSDDESEDDDDDDGGESSQSDEDGDSEEDEEEGDEDEEISSDSDSDEAVEDVMELVDVHDADQEEMDQDEEDNDHLAIEHNEFDEADEPDNDFFETNEEVEDDSEGNVDVDGEDWTTIETGVGHQFGSRNATLSVGRPRASGNMVGAFMETAETVIGNILRSGGLHMDEIAEIEGTLGIRLTNNLPPPEPFARIAGNISSRTRANNNSSSNPYTLNRVTLTGAIPTISQSNPPENFFLSIGGNMRMGEPNFMEYQYGGTPLGSDDREHFNVVISNANQQSNEDETTRIPSSFDSQLFPNGSAASTHPSSSHVNHPLLSGIQLPPANALVTRIIRQPEVRNRANNSNERGWTEIRLGGNAGINIFERRLVTGRNVDIRQSFDPLSSEFTSAFEQAFISSSRPPTASLVNSNENRLESSHQRSTETNVDSNSSNELTYERLDEDTEVANDPEPGRVREHSNTSDGENVATSLAASLRLSNHNENEDNESGQNINESHDTAVNDESDQIMAENEDGAIQNHDQADAALTNDESQNQHNDDAVIDNNQNYNSHHNENIDQPAVSSDTLIEEQEVQVGLDSQESNSLVCPPGMDIEVFSQLPVEMQQEIIREHQATESVAAQLDASSGLDPEALAALPEDMRQEVIAQEQNARRMRDQEDTPADPSNAEEMDNASFIASLAPDLRREILLTADEGVISTLPPDIVAEAQLLRERVSRQRRDPAPERPDRRLRSNAMGENSQNSSRSRSTSAIRRRNKTGKIRVDNEREHVIYKPNNGEKDFGPLVSRSSLQSLLSLMYLLSPVRPQKLLQKLFQNLTVNSHIRHVLTKVLISLLNNNPEYTISVLQLLDSAYFISTDDENSNNNFPPSSLLGTATDILEGDNDAANHSFFRRRRSTASAIALNLPISARCSGSENLVPPVVSRRLVGTLTFLTKNGGRISIDILNNFGDVNAHSTCFDDLLRLLSKDEFIKSSSNLEDLLTLIESICVPLSSIPTENDNFVEVSKREIDAAAESGKEWVDVPQPVVSPEMLKLLCMTLRLECCKDSVVVKVNNIARRLCKISANRSCILQELASVAESLGVDAKRDLRALRIRLNDAVNDHQLLLQSHKSEESAMQGIPSTTVALSASSSEVKLLRVLQTLHSLCAVPTDDHSKKYDGSLVVREELVDLLRGIDLVSVWEHLSACLHVVSILEGATTEESKTDITVAGKEIKYENESDDNKKKLQSSVAGLLSRFLPIIEAFFVVNSSTIETFIQKNDVSSEENTIGKLLGGKELVDFVASNKVLLNAILRSNPLYLDKGLRAMVKIPQCRPFLDFDVKRHWFRTQVGRLRKHAIRRHGTLRLTIRRQYVFEDAYHQLRLRDADEMRGRLHITFVNEEGVDAGGLSREFFGILAKEMFNPNYALFTSTEDGCTFQPNPHSSINPDHLSYFHFVGRIVGKALSDGFLLDAHFTRSLYKHMIGLQPTYHDMQAIDPDYYKNLKTILEYNLEDIGVELTFSTETHSFGRSHVVDLIPNGRNIKVTEETKEKYVSLVCQHRMTTAIETQIKAYLDGFYELVKPDLISIFTAKELELLISGMPDIDIHDLKKNTDYQGYRATDKEIEWFWNIMFSLNQSEKAAFLQFTTGSSKVPLNGFSELQGMRGVQKFSIHKVGGGANGALMSAHTCFNSLDLPVYASEEIMKEKLLIAIKEGGGAFLFS